MTKFLNLDFAVKTLNLKNLKDDTIFNIDRRFKWDVFFNSIFNKNIIQYTQYSSSALKANKQLFSVFCADYKTQFIVYGRNSYNDYDVVGLKFNSAKQKIYFLTKYSSLIYECTDAAA